MGVTQPLDITQASIGQSLHALSTTKLTAVDLAARFLHRIGKLDHRGPCFNSICILNPNVFEEAQASDDCRASGRPPRALEGIPFTVKDSYQVKGSAALDTEGIQVYVNGDLSSRPPKLTDSQGEWAGQLSRERVKDPYLVPGKLARDQFMIVMLARTSNGRSTGRLIMVD